MSIQLNNKEDFNAGIRRLMLAECETAIEAIEKAHTLEEKHEAVHECRKALKKVRACLRLLRFSIDDYKAQNIFFRDLGRLVSEIRDSTSHLETLASIKDQYSSRIYVNAFDKVKADLLDYRAKLESEIFEDKDELKHIAQALRAKVNELNQRDFAVEGFEDLKPAIEKVYQRGIKGITHSSEKQSVSHFHEWRKRVKYLRYQTDIINRIWPPLLEVWEDEMHELTDLTGFLHDVYNLQQIVKKRKTQFASQQEEVLFHALLEQQQKNMKQHALLLGRKIYALNSDKFLKLLETFWNVFEEEKTLGSLPEKASLEY